MFGKARYGVLLAPLLRGALPARRQAMLEAPLQRVCAVTNSEARDTPRLAATSVRVALDCGWRPKPPRSIQW
jgi:hypothetical protein